MDNNDLRKLKRSALINIIYELQKENKAMSDRIDVLEKELADKRIKIEAAGSIADASLALNDVFKAAQDAADQYMKNIELEMNEASEKLNQYIDNGKKYYNTMKAKGNEFYQKKVEEAEAKYKRIVDGEEIR